MWKQLSCVVLMLLLTFGGCQKKTLVKGKATPNKPEIIKTSSDVWIVLLPGGQFVMGNPNATGNSDEGPAHVVQLAPFAIDQFEVTQDQFARFEVPDPSQFKSSDRPVEQIRWTDAALYCNRRSEQEGLEPCYDDFDFTCNFEASGYRLPTEAEWEYAARAGQPIFSTVALPRRELDSIACYSGNSPKQTLPVGSKVPNAWGLHDMLGNVAEWCHDIYQAEYYAQSPNTNPRGPDAGEKRVMRGGSWRSQADRCTVTARQGRDWGLSDACFTGNTLGFRCVRSLRPEEIAKPETTTP